jgi:hypothetical protein
MAFVFRLHILGLNFHLYLQDLSMLLASITENYKQTTWVRSHKKSLASSGQSCDFPYSTQHQKLIRYFQLSARRNNPEGSHLDKMSFSRLKIYSFSTFSRCPSGNYALAWQPDYRCRNRMNLVAKYISCIKDIWHSITDLAVTLNSLFGMSICSS